MLASKFSPIKKRQNKIEKSIGFSGGKVLTQEYYFHMSSYSCVKEKNHHSRYTKTQKIENPSAFFLRINFS